MNTLRYFLLLSLLLQVANASFLRWGGEEKNRQLESQPHNPEEDSVDEETRFQEHMKAQEEEENTWNEQDEECTCPCKKKDGNPGVILYKLTDNIEQEDGSYYMCLSRVESAEWRRNDMAICGDECRMKEADDADAYPEETLKKELKYVSLSQSMDEEEDENERN